MERKRIKYFEVLYYSRILSVGGQIKLGMKKYLQGWEKDYVNGIIRREEEIK